MARVEVEIDDGYLSELAALGRSLESAVAEGLDFVIDLERHENEQEGARREREERNSIERKMQEAEDEYERQYLMDVHAALETLQREIEGDGGKRQRLSFRGLSAGSFRMCAWIESVRYARALKVPIRDMRFDMSQKHHSDMARAYLRRLIADDLNMHEARLENGSHSLLQPKSRASESSDDIPF